MILTKAGRRQMQGSWSQCGPVLPPSLIDLLEKTVEEVEEDDEDEDDDEIDYDDLLVDDD
jgi:hypothetical protein